MLQIIFGKFSVIFFSSNNDYIIKYIDAQHNIRSISYIQSRMASVELEATSNAKNLKIRFNTANEVTAFLTRFMGCIQRSRSALVNPKKRTLEELRSSKHAVDSRTYYYI